MKLHCSLVICTKNRREDLIITLQSVFHQSLLPDALIIVDDSTRDETKKSIEKLTVPDKVHIQFIRQDHPHTGLTAARNTGIRHIPESTDIVLFLDDDVTLEEGYLETILDTFKRNPDVYGVSGFIRTRYHNRSFPVKLLLLITGCIIPALVPVSLFGPRVTRTAEALYPLYQKPRTETVPAQWLSGCNMAYRSTVFTEGFVFDEHLVRYAQGEDLLFSHRLYQKGAKLLLSYNAYLTHRVSPSGRVPPLSRFVMILGYRRYAIEMFFAREFLCSIYYSIFCLQFMISSFVLSLKNYKNLNYFTESIAAYRIVRRYHDDLTKGELQKFNMLFSDIRY
jgi:GT2 family glycosyltransferase